MDWEASKHMQPTRVQLGILSVRFKNSDLRSKSTTGTVYIDIHGVTTTKMCTRNATNTSPCSKNMSKESEYKETDPRAD